MTLALGAILLFAVLAFGAAEQWARSIFQIAVFTLGSACAAGGRLKKVPLCAWPLLGMVLWGAFEASVGLSIEPYLSWNAVLDWSAYFVLMATAGNLLARDTTRQRFLESALWAGASIAFLALAQFFTSPGHRIYWAFPTPTGRSFGPFVNPDHYAALAELLLPIAIWRASRDRARSAVYLAACALIYGSIVASGSRAGALLGTAEVLILPAMMRSRKLTAPLLALALAAAGVAGWQLTWKRFQLADPFQYRREMALSSLDMIRARPWAGFGLGTYETVYPGYARFDTGHRIDHAHNDWLEWTAGGGLPALGLMLGFAAFTARAGWRAPWSCGVWFVLIHSLVDFPLRIPGVAALAYAFAAAASATTGLRSSPTPATLTTTSSPAFSQRGGLRAKPTPGGVPVDTTSPGSSVQTSER